LRLCSQPPGPRAHTAVPRSAVLGSRRHSKRSIINQERRRTMRSAHKRLTALGALMLSAGSIALTGCSRIPGRPGPGPEVVRPDEVLDFSTLYKTKCAACPGENGKGGASLPLANPVYLAVVGEDHLRQIAAHGVHGTLMPPFAKSSGGSLTDKQ